MNQTKCGLDRVYFVNISEGLVFYLLKPSFIINEKHWATDYDFPLCLYHDCICVYYNLVKYLRF